MAQSPTLPTAAAPVAPLVQEPPPPSAERLTSEQMREALRLNSPALVRDIYEAAQRQITFETGRQGRLDAKATGLLQAIGLSLTVAGTLGVQIVARPGPPTWLRVVLALAVMSTLVLGLIAARYATRALGVRGGYSTVSEHALFNESELREADQEEDGEAAAAQFRRYIIPQLWTISRDAGDVHQDKAQLIRCGQVYFTRFLGGVLAVCALSLICALACT